MNRAASRTLALGAVLVAIAAALWWLSARDEAPINLARVVAIDPATIERGAYLARVGNCAACHTARGGAFYAGGRPIDTPFGTVYASNLTPDEVTGIGRWSADHFWRAMHNGRSADGRLLYPAFPYPNYTRVTRSDADAIYAYLRSLPPVAQPDRAHALRFPYDSQLALAGWRALFFRPGEFEPDATQSAEWNRGAYLVSGLGHCSACHSARNPLGASSSRLDLDGGLIPMQNWYAPSLVAAGEAGVAHWRAEDVAVLLRTGIAPGASVLGPMAEVVFRSTQYLNDADLRAMTTYLRALPPSAPQKRDEVEPSPVQVRQGLAIYKDRCAQCHGDAGEGAPGAYPAIAGNRALTMDSPANVVRVVLSGGFAPATAGNPQPYGMPPFAQALTDDEVAAVVTALRQSFGNMAPAVSALQVLRYREGAGRR